MLLDILWQLSVCIILVITLENGSEGIQNSSLISCPPPILLDNLLVVFHNSLGGRQVITGLNGGLELCDWRVVHAYQVQLDEHAFDVTRGVRVCLGLISHEDGHGSLDQTPEVLQSQVGVHSRDHDLGSFVQDHHVHWVSVGALILVGVGD